MHRSMCRSSGCCDLEFNTSFMPAVNLHSGRFTDDNKIRSDFGVSLNECVGSNPITPFFHIAKVIHGVIVEQAQIAGNSHTVNHAWGAALFITGAPCIKLAVFNFSDEWIPRPGVAIANTDCINMRIIHQYFRPAADTADSITHKIKARFVKAQFQHFLLNPFTNRSDERFHGWNGANISQELRDLGFLCCYFFLNLCLNIHFLLLIRPHEIDIENNCTIERYASR